MFALAIGWPLAAWSEADSEAVDPAIRQQVMGRMVAELRAFEPTPETPRVEAVMNPASENRKAVYRLRREGLIETGPDSWIFIRMQSSHGLPEVGDVILAIDQRGRIRTNTGHVCGTVAHFVSSEARPARDPDDFFQRFSADDAAQPWIPWEE